MKIVVRHICHEEAEDIATHRKTDDRDEAVNEAKYDQKPTRIELRRIKSVEPDESARQVDDVVYRINLENDEHAVREKSGDTNEREYQAKQAGEWFNESVHEGWGGENKVSDTVSLMRRMQRIHSNTLK